MFLRLVQSVSSLILDSFKGLMERHMSLTFFLTMLVGLGGRVHSARLFFCHKPWTIFGLGIPIDRQCRRSERRPHCRAPRVMQLFLLLASLCL